MGGVFYCGYDNPRSIAEKGKWIREKGMLGLMYWEYDQDDANGTLRKAVWNAVMTP
jgi:chitinase